MSKWSGRKARLLPALGLLCSPILIVLALRWLSWEPYVIPSSSMVPTLLENDFILVNKSYYGLRLPFSRTWVHRWNPIRRGDVVVFKYPDKPETFFIKRVAAVAGDKVRVRDGRILINDSELKQEATEVDLPQVVADMNDFDGYTESNGSTTYNVLYSKHYGMSRFYEEQTVPEGQFFVMGDNRDNSSDSRVWGFVPETHVMGRASLIWLSCENETGLNFFNCQVSPFRASRAWRQVR